jgi:hypothetical protein
VGPHREAIGNLPRKYLTSIGLLLFFAVGGLWDVQSKMWRLAQSEVIREVVMRHQILLWAQGSRDFGSRTPTQLDITRFAEELDSEGYVASFGFNSPAKTVLAALLDYPPRVENSRDDRKWLYGWIVDKSTKKVAVVFGTGYLSWPTEKTAQVDGVYHGGFLCSALTVFEVEFKTGNWIVVGEHTRWVS